MVPQPDPTGSAYSDLVFWRADHPWATVPLMLPGAVPGGETDVLLVFENPSRGKKAAFHVENKRASGSFMPYQPEKYDARAGHWVGNPDYGGYDVCETVLLAPSAFYERHRSEAQKFTTFISHEDVAAFIPLFQP